MCRPSADAKVPHDFLANETLQNSKNRLLVALPRQIIRLAKIVQCNRTISFENCMEQISQNSRLA